MLIRYQGELYRVMSMEHFAVATQAGVIQTKLRNLRTGTQATQRFSSKDRLERVVLDERAMEFLYRDGDQYWFMDTQTYEQLSLGPDALGDAVQYLVPNTPVKVEFYEGEPINVILPKTVDLAVTDTPPALKGATVTSQLKPATTETGLVVNVPPFIEPGDVIRVDTDSGAYVSRAK